ncbi:MAG: NADP-dependent oxidoreductase, partial [Phycisphaerae bacterium]
MKALRLRSAGLVVEEMERPVVGEGEILVRVKGAGVTATELLWWPTTHTKEGKVREGAVVGHEFAGVVEGVGRGEGGVAAGDEVFGMNDWFGEGATAEFCVTRPAWVAAKPAGLGWAEAASVPIGALTAWQGLYERAKMQRGERVLVHGGSGGVGVYAVQLARRAGARVVTTASARNEAFLKELGAERVIDYHTVDFVAEAGRVDVVFDCVGGETLERSWDLVGSGGRVVTIAADAEGTADERVKGAFFIVEAKGEQLAEIAGLLARGELRAVFGRHFLGFDGRCV